MDGLFEETMISSTHDLPLRGSYFAEGDYLSHDLETGVIANRAGARIVALTDDFLIAMHNSLEAQLGPKAASVLAEFARDWGRRAGAQFAAEIEIHHGKPVSQLPLSLFAADLAEAFRHHGWGVFQFDFSRYAQGLIAVDVSQPMIGSIVKPANRPVDRLLADFLAGLFSHFAGVELAGVQTECRCCGSPGSRFVVTIPDRARAVESASGTKKNHAQFLEALCQARSAT
jgi:hypothetical protein